MESLYFFIVIFFAGFTQGLTGFGSILVAMPLLALCMDIKLLIPLLSLFALCINLTLTVKLRTHVKWSIVLPLVAASLPGIPVGVYILKTVPPFVLKLILGALLILFSSYLLRGGRPARSPAQWWKWPAGFMAGCLGGSIGANGPPIIVYVTLQPWPKDVMKSAMLAFFLMAGIGVSSVQAAGGLITGSVLKYFALGLPALAVGVYTGHKCYGRVSEVTYRKAVTVLLLLLGLLMFFQGIRPIVA